MPDRYLLVTIDTEVDKDPHWRVADPVSFRSVTGGIPRLLTPLFERHGVVPTYLLSPEVIEDEASVSVLRELGGDAELGTHLHSEFVPPRRTLTLENMAGVATDEVQSQHDPAVEAAKLEALTRLFVETFGCRPTAFRAGRFGSGPESLPQLAKLGYRVDSSVTPGLIWHYPQRVIDHRNWGTTPVWIQTAHGPILEAPLSIRAGGRVAKALAGAPAGVQRAARGLLGRRAAHAWLRPSWSGASELIHFVQRSPERILVLMFHSNEVAVGASPYSRTSEDVHRILDSLDGLLSYCESVGMEFPGLSAAADLA